MKTTINDKSLLELEKIFEQEGYPRFRARQVFRQIHVNKINDFDKMTDLSKKMREDLKEKFYFPKVKVLEQYKSNVDLTSKYLFQLDDNSIIEAVYMEYENRKTICISSQVGCRMGCKFCASTKNGLVRNLTAAELIEEVYELERLNSDINNIVIMGIGEPLDNFNNIIRFLKMITDENGRNLSHRSITLSTSGLAKQIYRLADSGIDVNLAISLHYPTDEKREKFMPITKKYKIDQIMKACDYYFEKTKRRISFEYVVIDTVNNTDKDVKELKKILGGRDIHINLIPLNPIEEFNYKSPKDDAIKSFMKKLTDMGINATIRKSMGQDINASCGQLRNNYAR